MRCAGNRATCGRLDAVKITDVTTFVIKNPPPAFGGKYFIVVKLTTDTGVVGYGEIYAAAFGPHVIASMVDDGRGTLGHRSGSESDRTDVAADLLERAMRCGPTRRWSES